MQYMPLLVVDVVQSRYSFESWIQCVCNYSVRFPTALRKGALNGPAMFLRESSHQLHLLHIYTQYPDI